MVVCVYYKCGYLDTCYFLENICLHEFFGAQQPFFVVAAVASHSYTEVLYAAINLLRGVLFLTFRVASTTVS
jgi:hypothetical protein